MQIGQFTEIPPARAFCAKVEATRQQPRPSLQRLSWALAITAFCLNMGLPVRPADAQLVPFGKSTAAGLGEAKVTQYHAGMTISAGSGVPCRELVGTLPVPADWDEQTVKIINEEITPGAKVTYRKLDGNVQQMLVSVPYLPAGEEIKVLVTYEIKTHARLAPEKSSVFKLPQRLTTEERVYTVPSIGIESRSAKLISQARQITKEHENAWDKIEALYDFSRSSVELRQEPPKGALEALKSGKGDLEDIVSLFVGLCRAINVPARTVWVPGGMYAEFYLIDEESKGHWIPCEFGPEKSFGAVKTPLPILQKGDNVRVPENKAPVRFVPEQLTGKGGKPIVKFVREEVDAGKAKRGL